MSRSPSTLLSSRTVRCAAVLLPLWAGTASPVQAQGGAQAMGALSEASERFSGLTVVCADFRQVLEVTLLGERRESRGELCQRRPNLFFMRFTEPQGDQVVADGSYFWIYYASVSPDQVVRLPLDPARGGLDFYREFLDRPAETPREPVLAMAFGPGLTMEMGLLHKVSPTDPSPRQHP